MSAMERPDHLVLGVGGTLGIAWLRGLLAGLESGTGWDLRECESFAGSSAGSFVAAGLAGGRRPSEGLDAGRWSRAAPDAVTDGDPPLLARVAGAVAAPLAPLALAVAAPGGAAMRAAALARVPRGRRRLDFAQRLFGATRFDPRLRVCAVDRSSGRRVVFGSPGAPEATVAEAVQASCAIPGVFAPVTIAGREYLDGGVWSPTNLDVSPAGRGERVLCVVPTGARDQPGAMAAALRTATRAALVAERLVLRSRGAEVAVVTPDAACARAMGPNLMDARRQDAVAAAGHAQGLRLAGAGRAAA